MLWSLMLGVDGLPVTMVQHEADGVPCLVQYVEYDYRAFMYRVVFFDSVVVYVPVEAATPHLDRMDWPDTEDYDTAARCAEERYIASHSLGA